jgi:hypothetical protein
MISPQRMWKSVVVPKTPSLLCMVQGSFRVIDHDQKKEKKVRDHQLL